MSLLLLSGVLLSVFLLHSLYLWIPSWSGFVGDALFRIAYFATVPLRPLALFVFPPDGHHWSFAHHVFTAMSAPFAYYGIWLLYRGFRRWIATRPRLVSSSEGVALSRRAFLGRSAAGMTSVMGSGFVGYVSIVSPQRICVRHYKMPVKDLPQGLDGMRLVQIADTHYGPYVPLHYLEDVIEQANGLGGDLMVLTGDYVHYTPDSIEDGVGVLRHLQAPLGLVGVLGNHDHWEGADAVRARFSKTAVRLIDNDRVYLTSSGISDRPGGRDTLCLSGVGDLWEDKVSFYKALDGVPQTMPRLLLSHNPDVAELLDETYRVDAMFCGHTHGGQVLIPGIHPIVPSRYGTKYLGGVCKGPYCPVVVSRGIGLTVLPVRFRVPPELVTIDLARA